MATPPEPRAPGAADDGGGATNRRRGPGGSFDAVARGPGDPAPVATRTRLMLLVAAIVVGALVTLQAPINAQLGKDVGQVGSAVVSFGVGFLVLLALTIVLGQASDLRGLTNVSWPYLLGGLIGAGFVLLSLVAVPKIGAGPLIAAGVTGQLVMAVVVDRFGWLGVPQHDLTITRVVGAVLLVIGVVLVSKR